MKNCLFGATAYDKKWSGYGVAFSAKDYLHENSGKNAKNLIIFGADSCDFSDDDETQKSNVLVLGKGSVQITSTETIKVKDESKANCAIINENCPCVIIVMIVICLFIMFNNINLKQNTVKLKQENCA